MVSFPPSLFLFGPEKGILSDVITFVVVLIQFFLRRADLVKLMIFFDKAGALWLLSLYCVSVSGNDRNMAGIGLYRIVYGDNRQTITHCLTEKHSVKRVPVQKRELAQVGNAVFIQREGLNPMLLALLE